MKKLTFADGIESACTVVLNDDGHILVVREPKVLGFLGLPGGKRERDEWSADTAQRELLEETGLSLPAARFESFYVAPVGGYVCEAFYAGVVRANVKISGQAQWVHPSRLIEERGTRFPAFNREMFPMLVGLIARNSKPRNV